MIVRTVFTTTLILVLTIGSAIAGDAGKIKVGDVAIMSIEAPIKFMNEKPLKNAGGIEFYRGDIVIPVVGAKLTALLVGDGKVYCRMTYEGRHGGLYAPNNTEVFLDREVFLQTTALYEMNVVNKAYPELYYEDFMKKFRQQNPELK